MPENEVNVMPLAQQEELIEKATTFFKEKIIPSHERNWKKLKSIDEFDYNPFLLNYLSMFLCGNLDKESKAKVLALPRALGTSINTSFGTLLQKCITKIFPESYGSGVPGMDIEFTDAINGHKKYCQLKAGPQTINDPDVETICNHFRSASRLLRTNNNEVLQSDMVVGVLYGKKMSSCYKRIVDNGYPVYMGEEFWYHLTGDHTFFNRLTVAFSEAVNEVNATEEFQQVINQLADDIEANGV